MDYLTPADIAARQPYGLTPAEDGSPLERIRARMDASGQWHKKQNAGRRWSIGCVSLEITQRCNLDCTLCYLSEASEAVKDIPLQEIFRRIDMIHAHYGDNTDVQVSGGDPTLRDRDELVQIVRYIRDKGMRSSLFTNGILAKRDMLIELRDAGLTDVAFHVDITQERKGYESEVDLNEIRAEYIERARGLGLGVFFNTTVCADNFHEIPAICEFFVEHADALNLVSFQLQADTGRGVLRERDFMITQKTVIEQINKGTITPLNFDASDAGHTSCNRYAMGVVANGKVHDALDDPDWINDMLEQTTHFPHAFDRAERGKGIRTAMKQLAMNPAFVMRSAKFLGRKAIQMAPDIIRGGGKAHPLAFFIHNFMDAQHLECERIDSCVFMVATPEGPMSMCLHNAKRDEFLLKPTELQQSDGQVKYWNPLTGTVQAEKPVIDGVEHTRKTARGRAKVRLEEERAKRPGEKVTVESELEIAAA